MASLAEVNFKISANIADFETAIRKAQKSFKTFGDGMKEAGRTMSMAFTAPIAALAAMSLKVAGSVEQTEASFEVLLKNADAAKKMVNDLQQWSASTPFVFMDTKEFATGLLAVGVSAKDIIPDLTNLGNLSMGNTEKMQRLTEAFEKAKAKGTVDMKELNMFTHAGVPIIQALADKFGVTTEAIFKMSKQGKLSFEDLNQTIIKMTTNGGQFDGVMKAHMSTLPGLFSNLMDIVQASLGKFGEAINKAFDLKSVIPAVSEWIKGLADSFDKLNPGVQKFILVTGGILAVMGPVLLAVGFLASNVFPLLVSGIGVAIGAFGGLKTAFTAMSVVVETNPIGALIAAIGLAVGAVMLFNSHQKEAVVSSASFNASLYTETNKLDELFRLTKQSVEGSIARKNGIDEINKAYGSYLPKLLTEKSSLQEITKAQKQATDALLANIALKAKEGDLKRITDKVTGSQQDDFQNIKDWVQGSESVKNKAQYELYDFLKFDKSKTDKTGNDENNQIRIKNFASELGKKYKLQDTGIGFDKKSIILTINDIINANIELSKSQKEINDYYDYFINASKLGSKAATVMANATGNNTEKNREFNESLKGQEMFLKSLEEQKKKALTIEEKVEIEDQIAAVKKKIQELKKAAEMTGILGKYEIELQKLQKESATVKTPAEVKAIQNKIDWLNQEIEVIKKYGMTAEQVFGMSKKDLDRYVPPIISVRNANKQIPLTGDKTTDLGLSEKPGWLKAWDKNTKLAADKLESFKSKMNSALDSFIKDGISTVAEGIGNILTGDGSLGNLLNGIEKLFGSFLKQMGAAVIAYAFTMEAFTHAFQNPFLAIAAGAALIVAGTVVSNLASKGPKGFANGGIVSGSSFSGDLIPARVNSGEMILNGMQQARLFAIANGGMINGYNGNNQTQTVTFKVLGSDLVAVFNNHARKIKNTK